MTRKELRAHPEYKVCMDKIIGYTPGFKFTMDYTTIPTAKANALKVILRDAVEAGYLESVSMGYDLDMNLTEETYRRTELWTLTGAKLIAVTVYRDSTDLYPEEEDENLATLMFPEHIVRQWHADLKFSVPFDVWYRQTYTADDTDGLYEFAKTRGFTAAREN